MMQGQGSMSQSTQPFSAGGSGCIKMSCSEKLNSTFKRRIKNVELSSTEVYTEHKYSVRKGFK